MNLRTCLSPLLPVLLLAACGGGEASFADVPDAMRQAERARASKDNETAAAAYEYVLANVEAPAEQLTALQGLYEVQLQSGDEDGALSTHGRIAAEHGDALDLALRTRLLDKALSARAVEAADQLLNEALEAHPESRDTFANQVAAVDKLKTEGPGADLSSLGYSGD